MSGWLLLAGAILTEVAATISLKLSDGFTKAVPTAFVIVGYLVSFYLLARVLSAGMSLGVVYAVWSAIGVALIVVADVIWFSERVTTIQVGGLFLVVLGVIALELGRAEAHVA
jgi:small multidrug resistance pump